MTRTAGKLGKLGARTLYGVGSLGDYAQGKLPTPPASVAVPNVTWPMSGNDQYGDCTIAGVVHAAQAFAADVGATYQVPVDPAVVQEYMELTGGVDSGLAELDVLHQWASPGILGSQIDAYAPVTVSNLIELHQAIWLFGGCYVGVQLPQSAPQQFESGQPWTVEPGDSIEGGHCIFFAGYSPEYLYAITWGAVQPVTAAWWQTYGEEAWCVMPHQFDISAKTPTGIDVASLRADLALI